jgi:hypothetical protein
MIDFSRVRIAGQCPTWDGALGKNTYETRH